MGNQTLWEINNQLRNLLELEGETENGEKQFVDGETGELLTANQVDALEIARDEKIRGCMLFIKEMEDMEARAKAEKKRMDGVIKYAQGKQEWCKQYLLNCLEGKSYQDSETMLKVQFRNVTTVELDEGVSVESLAPEYQRTKYSVEADKKKLLADLKAGIVVEGAHLATHKSTSVK